MLSKQRLLFAGSVLFVNYVMGYCVCILNWILTVSTFPPTTAASSDGESMDLPGI